MPSELRLFGGFSLLADGLLISGAAAQPRRIAVLAILADAWPAAVTRDRILGLIWPEQDESGARRLLTQALYELRRELGNGTIIGAGRDLLLDRSALSVDLIDFRETVRTGDVERAASLYRGPFLDGFYLRAGGEFERWTATVRDGSQRDLHRTLEEAIDRYEATKDFRAAARWAERSLEALPHDASVVVRAMDLFEHAGDPGAAARVAAVYERRMRDDLDLPADEAVQSRLARLGARPLHVVPPPTSSVEPTVESTPPAIAPPVPERRRWPVGWLVAAVAAFALMLGGGVRVALRASHPQGPVVSLMAFEVRGDSSGKRIVAAMLPLVAANLEGAGGVHVDTSYGTGVSARTLRGVLVSTGDQLRVDAELAPSVPDEEPIRASASGPADSLIVLAERLSVQLLPALYDNLDAVSPAESVRRTGSVSVARRYLDGESALRRAAFDSAYAAFKAATEADSSNAFLWYRRAVAAEEVHHIDDADRSATIADAGRGALPPRENQLVHAYAMWRSGDGRAADSLYRDILRSESRDAEGWFQFAEVSYHGGPLFGRPLDAARDAWRRAVALDSNSFPALMHAVRLEARAGNDAAIASLLRRAERVHAAEPFLSEARAIAAASGRRSLDRDDLRRLEAMPDASLQFVHAIIASFVERPEVAWEAASRLITAKRPDAVRAEGYASLAQLAMARGQTRLAAAMLDSLDRRNAVEAARWRSYHATLPFLPADSRAMANAAHGLANAGTRTSAAPLYLELSVDASIANLIRRYHTQLLAARGGERADRDLRCGEAAAGPEHALCADLEHGVAAEALVRAGRHADALRELEAMSLRAPYQLAGRSVYFARTRERFLRASLLERAGRLDEAYDWYAAVSHTARLDYVYLAPSHLARGRIRERQGNAAAAAEHYRRALELWSVAESDAGGIRHDASAGLERVTRAAR